jgi:hypothetical protein
MTRALRRHLSYANVMATLAMFIALGGSAYAALSITGRNVKNGSLTYRDLKRNTLGGTRIKEARLGKVPRARNADRLNGLSAARLLVRCPADTVPLASACVEKTARGAGAYRKAVFDCALVDNRRTPGRRLPTHAELQAGRGGPIQLTSGGELTSHVYPSGASEADEGTLNVLYVTQQGFVGTVSNKADAAKAFRCVAEPLN